MTAHATPGDGRDRWAEWLRARQPTAPDLDPPHPPLPAVYGGPDPEPADLEAAERVLEKWPAADQDLAAALAWVRGWRP